MANPFTAAGSRWGLYALLVASGATLAGVYAFGKLASGAGIPALALLAWQMLFATLVVGGVAKLRGQAPVPTPANLRYAAVAGIVGMTLPYFATFAALAYLPAGLVGAITAFSPLFTYGMVLGLRLERVTPHAAAGIALGLGGALAIALPGTPAAGGAPWLCVAVAAAAPVFLACGNVFRTLAWPAGLQPLGAAALMLAVQTAVLVPAALALGMFRAPAGWGAGDAALLGAGALTALFYLGAFELQRRGGPLIVGQLGYVIAAGSLAIGVLAFGERYSAQTLAAVAAVLAGVALVNARPAAAGARR